MNTVLPPLDRIPADAVALTDCERLAPRHLTPEAWAYFSGGAADEITMAANRSAFEDIRILPRVLRDLQGGSVHTRLLGRDLDFPLLLAPVAFQRLAHPEGECATALAAGAMRTGMVLSMQSSVSLEEVAAAAAAPLWLQLYLQPDRPFLLDLVRRAEALGFEALVVTVDAPLEGIRNRQQRAGFRLPADVRAVNLEGLSLPQIPPPEPGGNVAFGPLLDAAPTWQDISWLISETRLPVILKGILAPEDAELAVTAGCAGIIVSNHGGRVLDTVPATIEVLPEIVSQVAGRLPVLLDGGIRRGTDIFKALALGAAAVLIGRPVIHGLALAGAPGVAHVLNVLRAEFEVCMALAGCRTVADIRRACVRLTGESRNPADVMRPPVGR